MIPSSTSAWVWTMFAMSGVMIMSHIAQAAEPPASRVVAHRGLAGHAPENTLAAFKTCLELRIGFEVDIRRSRDEVLVCIHDDTVDRTTNGKGRVADLTASELQRLDAGTWFDPRYRKERIPTLDQVLALVARYPDHDVLIAIDLKADGIARDVVRMAEKHRVLHKLLFIGTTITDLEVRQSLRQASREAQIARVTNAPAEFTQALNDDSANWVYFRYIPSPMEMDQVRKAGKRSFVAGVTVSGHLPENWKQVIAVGMDGILTDYPLELAAQIRKPGK